LNEPGVLSLLLSSITSTAAVLPWQTPANQAQVPTLPLLPYLPSLPSLSSLSSGHHLNGDASHSIRRFYNTTGSESDHPGSGIMAQKSRRLVEMEPSTSDGSG